jgi:hypothetical protein
LIVSIGEPSPALFPGVLYSGGKRVSLEAEGVAVGIDDDAVVPFRELMCPESRISSSKKCGPADGCTHSRCVVD